jgi:hypothetical protein
VTYYRVELDAGPAVAVLVAERHLTAAGAGAGRAAAPGQRVRVAPRSGAAAGPPPRAFPAEEGP